MPESPSPPPLPGLLVAWRLAPGESPRRLDASAAAAALPDAAMPLWLHLDLVHAQAPAGIAACPRLPPAAQAMLLARDRFARFEQAEACLVGLLPDFDAEAEEEACDARHMSLLHVALVPGLLVTARRHALRSVARLREGPPPGASPALVLAQLIGSVAEGFATATDRLTDRMERIEDALLRGKPGVDRAELAGLRHDTLRLLRRLAPLGRLSALAQGRRPPWLAKPEWLALTQAAQGLESAAHALHGLQERGRICQDDLASENAEETNRRLLVLSVVSAAILPATLVAGIFGMNTAGLPGTEDPAGFAWAMGAIGGAVALTLALLRLMRLL